MFPLSLFKNSFSRINIQRCLNFSTIFRNAQPPVEERKLEIRDITKDRTQEIPLETSLRYLKSEAYRQTYGGNPVWLLYRYLLNYDFLCFSVIFFLL